MSWLEIGRLQEIPRKGARVVYDGERRIAVFRTAADEVFALLDRCPHRGGPLSAGLVHDRQVVCPLHDWSIDLSSGCACGPDEGSTPSFPVRVEEGVVWIELSGPAQR